MSDLSMRDLVALGKQTVLPTYRPLPIVIDRGEGARLFDTEGRSYIDFVAGVAVSCLGYGNQKVIDAINTQTHKIFHTSNLFWNEPQIMLSQELVKASFPGKVFFCNSGAEANEALIKLARHYFYTRGSDRTEIVCMSRSFHGRTLATISATGQEHYRNGFGPLLPDFTVIPFGDIDALKNAVTKKTAAVLLEPILGEGGLLVPPDGYLTQVREICTANGALMLLDEIQSGMGRTGKLFAYMHEGILPDVMTLAKGLGAGLPIGAMVVNDALGETMVFPDHGSTFGGNPVACAAARVVLREIQKPTFLDNVTHQGDHLLQRLREIQREFPTVISDVRGRGLWCGAQLLREPGKIREMSAEAGVIINICGGNVLRFAPPLIIDQSTLDQGLDIFRQVLINWSRQ